jgi:hypothetical protein
MWALKTRLARLLCKASRALQDALRGSYCITSCAGDYLAARGLKKLEMLRNIFDCRASTVERLRCLRCEELE